MLFWEFKVCSIWKIKILNPINSLKKKSDMIISIDIENNLVKFNNNQSIYS